MAVFDMGKNVISQVGYRFMNADPAGSPGWIKSTLYALRKQITELSIVPLSTPEIRELIVLLERTALELRQRIGEG